MMTTDKAYVMGLVIGGGGFNSDASSFFIKLPYRKWGDAAASPARAGVIAEDILKVVKPVMRIEYGMEVSYSAGRDWRIQCHGNTDGLTADLASFGISPSKKLHETADLSGLLSCLSDDNMKRRFIAGLADTIGSLAESHRRFGDSVQIISFEISGFNYKIVCQLCNLLYEVGCVPDQILWNHPNMHSGTDSYYADWKKGNKLRVTLDAFSLHGSLAFSSKAQSLAQNRSLQKGRINSAEQCETKPVTVSGIVAVHADENSQDIPEPVRGGHYLHHKQICAVLNCPHAPLFQIRSMFREAEHHVSPFTVLHKDTAENISRIIDSDALLRDRIYKEVPAKIADFFNAMNTGKKTVVFSAQRPVFTENHDYGYPLNTVMDAFNFIIGSLNGTLKGRRPRGNRDVNIRKFLLSKPDFTVTLFVPDIMTPLIMTSGKVSAMIGPLNSSVYSDLISYDSENEYKMTVRKITECDLMK